MRCSTNRSVQVGIGMSSPSPIDRLHGAGADSVGAVERANELMSSGQLFRYGESGAEEADASLLEAEFAHLVGRRFCVAFNSRRLARCGARRRRRPAGRHRAHERLHPRPGAGAIARQATPRSWASRQITSTSTTLEQPTGPEPAGSLSHMRGHVTDLDAVVRRCDSSTSR